MKLKGGMNKMWICEECTVVFQIYSVRKTLKRAPFCPSCGDRFEVVPYSAKKFDTGVKITRPRWKPEEIELVKKCLTGEKAPHQVAIELGRTLNSVKKYSERLRKSSP